MANQSYVRLYGVRETQQNLLTLSHDVQERIARTSVRSLNFRILDVIRDKTYTTFSYRSGLIESGFGVRTGRLGSDGAVASFIVQNPQVVSRMSRTALTSVVRRSHKARLPPKAWVAFYWRFLEFGTNTRSNQSGANRGSVSSKSWIRPAFVQASQGAISAFQKLFAEMTDEAIAKLPPTIPGGRP